MDHSTLYNLICKKVHDPRLQKLIWIVIDSHSDGPGRGLPIGNLTSQLFANIYLDQLDQFVKHNLRERYYVRYMDDFLILSRDKVHLHQVKSSIKQFVGDELQLTIHPHKATVAPTRIGINFLGYVLYGGVYRRLRKSSVKRFQKRFAHQQRLLDEGDISLERVIHSVQSWNAYANKARSWRLRQRLYRD